MTTPTPQSSQSAPAKLDDSALLILGSGRLGRSLQGAFEHAGLTVRAASGREPVPQAALHEATLAILAVPDQAIAEKAAELAAAGPRPSTCFVHLSGALGLEVLAPLRERGCAVGSFHPFQPFAAERPPTAFHGATIGIDADDDALRRFLPQLAERLGAHARPVPDADRALYHAAAVMASTYVVALAAQAQQLLQALGWSRKEALVALIPLIGGTLENLANEGVPDAITGPLRRGDVDTIAHHLDALARVESSTPANVYRVLGLAATDLARAIGLEPAAAERVTALLRDANAMACR